MVRAAGEKAQRVLFLGYGRDETALIAALENAGCAVEHTGDAVCNLSSYDLIVSYGYRHILKQSVIDTAVRPILNLHIAYLPWNRGAHPLFWAAYDESPSGVTIHAIDAGIDTGRICFQEEVPIDYRAVSFAEGYSILRAAMECLFLRHMDAILASDVVYSPQVGSGSVKRVRDLPSGFTWQENIAKVVTRLKA